MRSRANLLAILLFASTACVAISVQHFWISHPGGPGAGLAGVSTTALKPIRVTPDSAFDISEGESKLGYVKRVTDMVHLTTYHCEPTNFQLSSLDRFSLWLSGTTNILSEGILVKDRFTCGFCHQRAFLVHQILQRNGINSEVFGLNGHVVDRVDVDGSLFYADPDYGVGPFSTASESLEGAVRANYSMAAQADPDLIAGFYVSNDDNSPYGNYIEGIHDQQLAIFQRSELLAYVLLLVGITGTIASVFLYRQNKNTSKAIYIETVAS